MSKGVFSMFGIKELCQQSNISQQTFYRLCRDSKEFRNLVETNREKKGNGYKYKEPVLSWLLDYYGIEPSKTENKTASEPPETPSHASAGSPCGIDALTEINSLKAEIEALRASISEKEKEIEYLRTQNAQILCLFQMEKQEKALLLTAPKKSLVELIRKAFTKGKKEKAAE